MIMTTPASSISRKAKTCATSDDPATVDTTRLTTTNSGP